MSETKTKQPAPFQATLKPDGIVLEDEGDRRYNALVSHPKFGRDFKAGKPLTLPTTNGAKLKIVDTEDEVVLFEDVTSLQVEHVLGFIHVVGAENGGVPVKLPPLPKAWEVPGATSAPPPQTPPASSSPLRPANDPEAMLQPTLGRPAATSPLRPNPMGRPSEPPSNGSTNGSTNGAAAGPIVDQMVELELRALISDQAKKQQQEGNTKGWAIVLKGIVDKRIQTTPAAAKEPLAALMLKGLVEKGAQDAFVQEAICKFCIQVAKGDAALGHVISDGAKKFATGLNNPYAIEMPEDNMIGAVTGMNLFAKAMMKLDSKAYGTRMDGIAYIAQQIPYEAGKGPTDPRDQALHIKRIQDVINKVEGSETFQKMVDKKAQAQYKAGLDRAKDVLKRYSGDKKV